jgi:CBS domain-containing protein
VQDVFPVVRGDRLVGAVARQSLIDQLQTEGDGYLQGMMTRALQLAQPEEPLVAALRRASARGASEIVPVAKNGRLLGILTPQNLGRAVLMARAGRRAQEPQ